MFRHLMRSARTLGLAAALLLGMSAGARAQFFGGGYGYPGYGYGYPSYGYAGYGYPGYGYGYPGGAYGFGYGYAYPAVGYGGLGYGYGYPSAGIGSPGYNYAATLYPPFLAAPAYPSSPLMGLGLTPLGVQSGLTETFYLGRGTPTYSRGYRIVTP